MIRITSLLALSAVALLTASCGCKQAVQAPALRSMPNFKEIPSATGPEIGEDIAVQPSK